MPQSPDPQSPQSTSVPQEPDPQSPQSTSMPQAPDPQSPQSTSMPQAPDPQSPQSTSVPQEPDPQSPQSTSMPRAPDPQSPQSTSMPRAPDPQSPQSTSMPRAPDPQSPQSTSMPRAPDPQSPQSTSMPQAPDPQSPQSTIMPRAPDPQSPQSTSMPQAPDPQSPQSTSMPRAPDPQSPQSTSMPQAPDPQSTSMPQAPDPQSPQSTGMPQAPDPQSPDPQSPQSTSMPEETDQESLQPIEMSRVQMLDVLNTFGSYQRRLLMLLFFPLIMSGYRSMSVIVIFYSPDHRCRVPGLANDTYSIQNEAHRMMVNLSIPMTSSDGDISDYAQCEVYKDRGEWYTNRTLYDDTESCNSWVYDDTDFERTIVTQFDLVCENKGFRANFNMLYMLGLLAGSSASGVFCDRFGRKKVFLTCLMLSIVVTIVMAFPVVAPMLLVYRFLAASLGIGAYLSLFVLTLEFMGVSQRTLAGSLMPVLWVTGPFLAGGLSYVIRDWRWLQLLNGAPFIFLVSYWWLIDESPRWLLAKGHAREAQKVILKIMKVNKMTLPADNSSASGEQLGMKDLKQQKTSGGNADTQGNTQTGCKGMVVTMDEQTNTGTDNETKTRADTQQTVSVDKGNKVQVEEEEQVPPESPLKLFKYPNLIARTGIIFFNWSAVSTTYYGLSLNVANLGGSIRQNFMFSNLVDLLGGLAAWALLDRLGRKRTHCAAMLLSGTSCLATIFSVMFGSSDLHWLTILLVMVGKLGISAAFSTVYLMSGELFPTVMRNIGMGCSSTVARVATALSPYIADLSLHIEGKLGRALPLAIFSSLGLAAGLLALCLPETLHRKLPDTIMETANFTKQKSDDLMHVQQATADGKHEP